jgi:hypothetical protein
VRVWASSPPKLIDRRIERSTDLDGPEPTYAAVGKAKPDWSVVHNPEVRQTLNVHLAHTFKLKSMVNHVKFSREGKYLALGLTTGETYIYDIKTSSNRFLPFCIFILKAQLTSMLES